MTDISNTTRYRTRISTRLCWIIWTAGFLILTLTTCVTREGIATTSSDLVVTSILDTPPQVASVAAAPTVDSASLIHVPSRVVSSMVAPSTTEVSPAYNFVSGDDVFLDELAKDTWSYLSSDWASDNHLPWSWRSESLSGGDFANPAEIGFYALSWLGAYEMNQPWSPAWPSVEAEVSAMLDQLRSWQVGSQASQPHGPNAYGGSVFYQWYWINWDPPVVGAGANDHVVPSIDNAWLAASLITIREYGEVNGHHELAQKADAILANMDFVIWYDFATHRFSWGGSEDPLGGGETDYYSNENRIINFIAYTLGQLSTQEFHQSLDALVQDPDTYNGIMVEKVAWDGSYFTYISPALFIREIETTYGENTIIPATQAQIEYALDQGYDAWGLSDSYDVGTDGYIQQGAPPAASPDSPETRPGIVSPHASALALITPFATEAITNLQTISDTFPSAYQHSYGFFDSVMTKPNDPQYGQASERFSALNQEWIFLSIVDAQVDFIWNYFYRDEGVIRAHVEMFGQPQVHFPIVVKDGF